MLEVNKNITLTGISKIDGVQVAYMSATISSDGGAGANVNKNIFGNNFIFFINAFYS